MLDTLGRHPAFVIEAAGQKSRRAEVAPVTPDFAQWILDETPETQRIGRVFPITGATGKQMVHGEVGRAVSAIGRKAGAVVGETEKVRKGKAGKLASETVKLFAGAHDLRRGFCTRWAKRVMPPVLQRLARHSHISTTLTYYVVMDADEISADLWAQHGPGCSPADVGNIPGNTPPAEAPRKPARNRCKSFGTK